MFSFFKEDRAKMADIFVDLGTANTLIAVRGHGVLINEPTLIACSEVSSSFSKKTVVAVGLEAKEKMKKTPGSVISYRPLRDGVIADYDTTEAMLHHFLHRPEMKAFMKRPRIVISLPFGVTEVEKRAAVKAGKSAGAKDVILIDEPMAAAIGSDLPIKEPRGNMVVDIGGGTTEVAVIALADTVYCQAIRVGGYKIDESIVDYFKKKKKFIITHEVAEYLKIQIGTATAKKDIKTAHVLGRNADSGLQESAEISSEEVGNAMDYDITQIVESIHMALEKTPPELVSDIIESGLVLSGGGALIRDLDLRLQNEIRVPILLAKEPLLTVVRGGEKVLNDPELLAKIQLEV